MLGGLVIDSKDSAATSSKRPRECAEDKDSSSRKEIRQADGQEEHQSDPLSDQPNNENQANADLQGLDIPYPCQPDNEDDHLEEKSDCSSLIQPLGRELTISCLALCSRFDYGTIALLNKSFCSLVQSGLLYKIRRTMGTSEHWVYLSCNLLEWEVFDPIHCGWKSLPRMISNGCFMCSDKESLAVGIELLVFGKEIQSHVIYRYSILTNAWTSGMTMNTPRCLFASASLGEIAILAGGCDLTGKVLSCAELYNSENGTWTVMPNMNTARKMCAGVFMDGKFHVIGGIGTEANAITSGEVYDSETMTWKEIPNMRPPRGGSDAVSTAVEAPPLLAVVKNELYAANHAERALLKYDKDNNAWNTIGRLPEGVDSMNGWGMAFRACGDQLIVVGGPRAFGDAAIEINGWVPDDGPPQWKLLGTKPSGGFVYNCAIMGC